MQRLNYIGSKYQLLDWLEQTICSQTGWPSLQGKRMADLFAGTGCVSYHWRCKGAIPIANDVEPYSAVIVQALVETSYTPECQQWIDRLNADTRRDVGFITRNYSPYNGQERMYWTVENAQRIDFIRKELEPLKGTPLYTFLLASLIQSADRVSNVPAVYGCYLKNFKAKALQPLVLQPIHTCTDPVLPGSSTTQQDVLTLNVQADAIYLDPPYNERQYSKNYFPLNMIVEPSDTLKGKTGIPDTCFVSPFCSKRNVQSAFRDLLKRLHAPYVFLSYSSQSLLSKQQMIQLLSEFGDVSCVEKDYKQFKSFSYNESMPLTEYLFCIRPTNISNQHLNIIHI